MRPLLLLLLAVTVIRVHAQKDTCDCAMLSEKTDSLNRSIFTYAKTGKPFTGTCYSRTKKDTGPLTTSRKISNGNLLSFVSIYGNGDTLWYEDLSVHDSIFQTDIEYNELNGHRLVTTYRASSSSGPAIIRVSYYEGTDIPKNSEIEYSGKQLITGYEWYVNGKTKSMINYRNNVRDGVYREWNQDGILIKEYHYKNNVEDGDFTMWYNDGKKESHSSYKNGVMIDSTLSWYPDGSPERKGFLKDGKEEGKQEYWYPDKVKGEESYYHNGQLDGELKKWNTQGVLIADENYDHGKKSGRITYWYDDGSLQLVENYSEGMHNGISSYYVNGKKVADISFRNDSLDGKFLTWWPANGNPQCSFNYSMNVRNGDCKRWNEKGDLVFHRKYKNGDPAGDFPVQFTISSSCNAGMNSFTICDSGYSVLKNELAPFFNFPVSTDSVNIKTLLPLEIVYSHAEMPAHLHELSIASHAYISISLMMPFVPEQKKGYMIFGSTFPHSETFYAYEDGEYDEIPASDVMAKMCLTMFGEK